MSIHNLGSAPGAGRPTGPAAPRTTLSGGMPAIGATEASDATAARSRRDTVQISDAARALGGAERADAAPAGGGAPLTAERVAELRRRVVEGAYDAPSVADQVARRLHASGDL